MHRSAVGLGSLSVGLSFGALATALTGFSIVASPALAGVATVCGLASVGFATASKRLNRKATKHEKIYTLALAKRNSINELISKALEDKRISDAKFRIISREVEKYHELKASIRAGVTKTNTNTEKKKKKKRQQTRLPHKPKRQTSRNSETNFAKRSNLSFKKS